MFIFVRFGKQYFSFSSHLLPNLLWGEAVFNSLFCRFLYLLQEHNFFLKFKSSCIINNWPKKYIHSQNLSNFHLIIFQKKLPSLIWMPGTGYKILDKTMSCRDYKQTPLAFNSSCYHLILKSVWYIAIYQAPLLSTLSEVWSVIFKHGMHPTPVVLMSRLSGRAWCMRIPCLKNVLSYCIKKENINLQDQTLSVGK